ncbi:MAG: MMPL family transporter [Streptomyces sp.]
MALGAWDKLESGGFEATGTEAATAEAFVRSEFRSGPPDLTLLVTTAAPVDDPSMGRAGRTLTQRLRERSEVLSVRSYWDTGDPAMRAGSGHRALITVLLAGAENERVASARRLVPLFTGVQTPLTVRATGPAWSGAQATDGSERDLLTAELVSAPLILLTLILVFRSVIAAALPLVVGAVAVIATLAALRPLAALMPLSVFSTNLTAALGFGLTVDYCLFLFTRYRHELAAGRDPCEAISVSLRTAGRAAVFSSVTIAAAMAALLCFPVPFLRSMACAGLVVALCAAAASCLLIPPLLIVLGPLLDRGSARDPWRVGVFWTTAARTVTTRPALWGIGALLVLIGMLIPTAHLQLGPLDERILPSRAQAHAVADQAREEVPAARGSALVIAAPGAQYVSHAGAWESYARAWSRAEPTGIITTPAARYRAGKAVGPGDGGLESPNGAWFSTLVPHPPQSAAAQATVHQARALPSPTPVHVGGDTARFIDTRDAIKRGLAPAGVAIVLSTVLLLFCFTGSVFLPLKAVTVAAVSMSACFGVVVWAFQDGHLGSALGEFTVTGTVNACILLLMFCVAFGLSMDYETFLLARIQEEYRRSGDNRQAVETGIAHTGRLVTVAAIAVAASMAGLATSDITLLKMLGFGLAIGVVIDATLVRTILVPACMCLVGRANWWAPPPFRRVHSWATGKHTPARPAQARH